MIQIIAGEKGKGKTKILLDKANAEVLTTTGTLAFIDKNNRHMYELNNKIRLISAKDYFVNDAKEFTGFIAGLISQDNDTFNTDQVLTLVCVRPMVKAGEIDRVAVELQKMADAEKAAEAKRLADKQKNEGKWYKFWKW